MNFCLTTLLRYCSTSFSGSCESMECPIHEHHDGIIGLLPTLYDISEADCCAPII